MYSGGLAGACRYGHDAATHRAGRPHADTRAGMPFPVFPSRLRKRPVQLELPLRTWGGRRAGAGRKPNGAKAGVSHLKRPEVKARHPVHVTLRLAQGMPGLRQKALATLVFTAFGGARAQVGARVVHFSVQSNHLHLLVEADGERELSRAIQGLSIRLARRLNGRLGRRGSVFSDRYHSRVLRTPLEVRRALVYVLKNRRRHHTGPGRPSGIDPFSTARYFDGFAVAPRWPRSGFVPPEEPPVAPARTWLLRAGWRRLGLLRPDEVPAKS